MQVVGMEKSRELRIESKSKKYVLYWNESFQYSARYVHNTIHTDILYIVLIA
jgi:hypothetical protein